MTLLNTFTYQMTFQDIIEHFCTPDDISLYQWTLLLTRWPYMRAGTELPPSPEFPSHTTREGEHVTMFSLGWGRGGWLRSHADQPTQQQWQRSGQLSTVNATHNKVDRVETTRQVKTAVLHNRPADREDPWNGHRRLYCRWVNFVNSVYSICFWELKSRSSGPVNNDFA